MRLQVLQEDLVKALSVCSRFCSSHAQLPILSNLLLQSSKNKMFINATNLEMPICFPIGAKTEVDGEITVPSKSFFEMVSNMNKGMVMLEVENEQIKISSGKFTANIAGMNSSDFPAIPQKISKNAIVLSKSSFVKSIKKVLFAVSLDETRPALTGVLLVFANNSLSLVATDGFRLSFKKSIIEYGGQTLKVIIPKNILGEIQKIESESDKIEISIDSENNQMLFSLGDVVLTSRLIEGEFPDFEKIIPKTSKYVINADLAEIERSIKLASVFSRESSNTIKFVIARDSLKVLSESQKIGSQENEVEAKVETEDEVSKVEVAYNYKYILDFIGCVESGDVSIEVNDTSSPGKFLDPGDKEYLHLIMPIKI